MCRRGPQRSQTTSGRTWSRTHCRAGRAPPPCASPAGTTSTDPESTMATLTISTDPERTTATTNKNRPWTHHHSFNNLYWPWMHHNHFRDTDRALGNRTLSVVTLKIRFNLKLLKLNLPLSHLLPQFPLSGSGSRIAGHVSLPLKSEAQRHSRYLFCFIPKQTWFHQSSKVSAVFWHLTGSVLESFSYLTFKAGQSETTRVHPARSVPVCQTRTAAGLRSANTL